IGSPCSVPMTSCRNEFRKVEVILMAHEIERRCGRGPTRVDQQLSKENAMKLRLTLPVSILAAALATAAGAETSDRTIFSEPTSPARTRKRSIGRKSTK